MMSDFDYELDPGIRDLVRLLHSLGFETSDSGDGKSKCTCPRGDVLRACRIHGNDADCLPFPHAVIAADRNSLLDTADRVMMFLASIRPSDTDWQAEAVYQRRGDGTGIYIMVQPCL